MWSRAEWRSFVFLFVLGALLLGVTPFLRGSSFLGSEAAAQLRTVGILHQTHAFPIFDALSFQGRKVTQERGYSFLLSWIPQSWFIFVPFFFGLLNFVLFFFLLKDFSPSHRFISCLFFLLTPAFLFFHSTLHPLSVALTLLLLSGLFFRSSRFFFGILCLSLLPLFSIVLFFFSLASLILFALFRKIQWKFVLALFFIGVIVCFFTAPWIFHLGLVSFSYLSVPFFTIVDHITLLFVEFGGFNGVSFFLFCLALYGGFVYLSQYRQILFGFLCFLLSLGFFFLFSSFIAFFILPILFFAAFGFTHLLSSIWKSGLLKYAVLLVFIVALGSSTIFYFESVPSADPSLGLQQAFLFLDKQSSNGTILAPLSYGRFLELHGKSVYYDDIVSAPGFAQRWDAANTFYHTSDPAIVQSFIGSSHIEYLLIDSSFKEKTWTSKDDGVLFFVHYAPKLFGKIYDREGVEIYLVFPPDFEQKP